MLIFVHPRQLSTVVALAAAAAVLEYILGRIGDGFCLHCILVPVDTLDLEVQWYLFWHMH